MKYLIVATVATLMLTQGCKQEAKPTKVADKPTNVKIDTVKVEPPLWHLEGVERIWNLYGKGDGVRVVVDEVNFDINNSFIAFNKELSKDLKYPSNVATEWAINEADGGYHGTAVAGLVRQACPNCDIVAVRREGSRPLSYIKTLRYADSIKADILVSAVQLPYYSDILQDWYDNNNRIKVFYAAPRPNTTELGGMYDHDKVEVIGAMDWNYQPTDYTNQIYANRYYRIGSNAVWTADIEGVKGKYVGDFMPDFGGTSAAAPIVAGIEACKLTK